MEALKEKLAKVLSLPLPGETYHDRLAHPQRSKPFSESIHYRKSAVAITFIVGDEDPDIILIVRADAYGNDKHRGQISFPGGAMEKDDADLKQTAMRETFEEIGLSLHTGDCLGALTPLYIPVSQFQVFPFIFVIDQAPLFALDRSEVSSVIRAPLSQFTIPQKIRLKDLQMPNGVVFTDIPGFQIGEHFVWGATAMIMSECIEILYRAGYYP